METLTEYLKAHKPLGFSPRPRYIKEADAIVFFFKADESYAKRLDDVVTLYLSTEEDSLVGCKVKGAKSLLQAGETLSVHVQRGKVDLSMIIKAFSAKASKDDKTQDTYRRLSDEAERLNAKLEDDDLVPA
jgi:hypothetical protein